MSVSDAEASPMPRKPDTETLPRPVGGRAAKVARFDASAKETDGNSGTPRASPRRAPKLKATATAPEDSPEVVPLTPRALEIYEGALEGSVAVEVAMKAAAGAGADAGADAGAGSAAAVGTSGTDNDSSSAPMAFVSSSPTSLRHDGTASEATSLRQDGTASEAGSSTTGLSEAALPIEKRDLRKVLVIYTGGTIGMKATDRGFDVAPGFLPSVLEELPMFNDKAFPRPSTVVKVAATIEGASPVLVTPESEYGHRTVFVVQEYVPLLDSCNIRSTDWARMAQDIYDQYRHWDAFVVLHGTDTLAYTASALSFMLENLTKTVVVTGSQIPIVRPRNDGITNLLGALNIAGHFDIPEVCVVFGDKLLRGNRCTKMDASALSAFQSPNCDPLAKIGITTNVRWDLVRASPKGKLRLRTKFSNDLQITRIYPGPFTTIRNSLKPPLRGLILQTFGAGNAPDGDKDLIPALAEASARGLVCVNVTQCPRGEVEAHYATGTALTGAGVVGGGDMTGEAALVKLGWLLGHYTDPDTVRKKMVANLRGEITPHTGPGGVKFSLDSSGFVNAVWQSVLTLDRSRSEAGVVADGGNALKFISKALMPTLLCSAASNGNLEDMRAMVSTGADPTESDYDGRTPMHLAASEGKLKIVEYLISREVGVNDTDRFGGSPLLDAVRHKHVDVAKALLEVGAKLGVEPTQLAGELDHLAGSGDVSALELFYEAGADFNVGDYDGRTPLHLAASHGQLAVAQFLLKHRVDPSPVDNFGGTPLQNAITAKSGKVIDALVKADAEMKLADGELAGILCGLAKRGDVAMLGFYQRAGADLSAADYDGRTALHIATCEANEEAVQRLLEGGARTDVKDRWGKTPVEEAMALTDEVRSRLLALFGSFPSADGYVASDGALANDL